MILTFDKCKEIVKASKFIVLKIKNLCAL